MNNPNSTSQYLDKEELFQSLVIKAYAARLLIDKDFQYYGDVTLKTIAIADEILTQLKLFLTYESDKIRLIRQSNMKAVYYSGTETCFTLYEKTGNKNYLTKAFYYIEKSKSHTLFEEINLDIAYQKRGASMIEIKGFKKNTIEIEKLQTMLDTLDRQSNQYQTTFDKSRTLSGSIDSFRANYVQKMPYFFLSNVSTLKEVQSKLRDKEVLLTFLEVRGSLYLLIIKNNGIEGVTYKLNKDLKRQINNYRNSIDSSYLPHKFFSVSHQLHQSIITPIKKYLVESSRLIIIPHGRLNNVYFDALITNKTEYKNSFATFDYLIDSFDISYHYSSSLWCTSKNQKKDYDYDYIGLAPFAESSSEINISNKKMLLSSLPHTRDEVSLSAQTFEYNLTKTALANEAHIGYPSNQILSSKIIHYATHSILVDGKVYYCLLDSVGRAISFVKEDLYLHSFLSCELLILSSCNSGQGKYITGEGVMSIVRPALYQDISNILVTLTPIPDNTSSELIQYFLQYISEGDSYLVAINKAKREIKNQDTFPISWASFMLIGGDE